ncbi:hypothetical protein N657DRAFT_356006 [Parathielavia appendiculata]|uniref:Uncharacterized protein n=1 Tax=Parathielavia appendiculata TaxID=2587402 RepID=A0AAN6U2K0_9PEZI|nr:hypothetical protein N657DRAFT_356006 [Parathielavia appendiculata]
MGNKMGDRLYFEADMPCLSWQAAQPDDLSSQFDRALEAYLATQCNVRPMGPAQEYSSPTFSPLTGRDELLEMALQEPDPLSLAEPHVSRYTDDLTPSGQVPPLEPLRSALNTDPINGSGSKPGQEITHAAQQAPAVPATAGHSHNGATTATTGARLPDGPSQLALSRERSHSWPASHTRPLPGALDAGVYSRLRQLSVVLPSITSSGSSATANTNNTNNTNNNNNNNRSDGSGNGLGFALRALASVAGGPTNTTSAAYTAAPPTTDSRYPFTERGGGGQQRNNSSNRFQPPQGTMIPPPLRGFAAAVPGAAEMTTTTPWGPSSGHWGGIGPPPSYGLPAVPTAAPAAPPTATTPWHNCSRRRRGSIAPPPGFPGPPHPVSVPMMMLMEEDARRAATATARATVTGQIQQQPQQQQQQPQQPQQQQQQAAAASCDVLESSSSPLVSKFDFDSDSDDDNSEDSDFDRDSEFSFSDLGFSIEL